MSRSKYRTSLRPYQRDVYQRGLCLLLEAFDILGNVPAHGWTQRVLANEVYLRLQQAAESLVTLSHNDLPSVVRNRFFAGVLRVDQTDDPDDDPLNTSPVTRVVRRKAHAPRYTKRKSR